MAGANDIRAGGAYVEVRTEDAALMAGLDRAADKLRAFGASVTAAGFQASLAGGALSAPIVASATAYGEHGKSLTLGAAKTGVSVEALSLLQYAAKQSGVDIDQLNNGLNRMGHFLTGAVQGSKEAATALATIHLSIADLNALSPQDRFKTIAEAIRNVRDPSVRAAEAIAVFGRSGADLLPLAANIDTLTANGRILGQQWSGEDAAAGMIFASAITDLWDVLRRGSEIIGSSLAPSMLAFTNILIRGALYAKEWAAEHTKAFSIIKAVGITLTAVGAGLLLLGATFSVLGVALGTIASLVGAVGAAFSAVLSPIGLVIVGIGGAAGALMYFSGIGTLVGNALIDAFKSIYGMIKFVLDNTSSASQAWGAVMHETILFVQQEWARAKGYLVDIWIDFKGFMSNLWDDIGIDIVSAASDATKTFLDIWAKAMHGWSSLVNTTADWIQQTFLDTGKAELKTALEQIDQQEHSGQLTPKQAEQGRAAAHKTFDDYDAQQRAMRDKANDDDLQKKLNDIKAEADAKQQYLNDLRAKQRQANDAESDEERAGNDKKAADAAKAAADARAAYEQALKQSFKASGQQSILDQLKSLSKPLTKPVAPGAPDVPDLESAAKSSQKSLGTFTGDKVLLREIFGHPSKQTKEKHEKEIADNTREMKASLNKIANNPFPGLVTT
jgi:hypothetical protein